MSKPEESCVDCGEMACGNCENCDASLCPEHESYSFEDVMTCKDVSGCTDRIVEKGEK